MSEGVVSEAGEFGFGGSLSEDSRVALGLAPGEGVGLIVRSERMLLLERRQSSGTPMPIDRNLVLSCDVRAFALADLLALLNASGKSGYLVFEFEDQEKAVYLSRGEVVFAESNLGSDRLGASLFRAGLLDQSQLELAESRYHPATRFGKVVVELGMLTPRDLWNGVKTQVEDIVRSLFAYTGGWIHFWEGEIEPDNVVRLNLPTKRLIAEGLERRDDLIDFIARLEGPRSRIRLGESKRTPVSVNEKSVLEALSEHDRFAAICRRTGLDPRTAARTLQFLALTGDVSIEESLDEAETDYGTADDDVVREAVQLHTKLVTELTAPLIAIDGALPVAERLNRIVEESALRGLALLEGALFSKTATLDPAELEHRALRLAGDRVRAVEEALGEIVAYLEFELKNHPLIDDCEPFLEAVDPLRAMLIR